MLTAWHLLGILLLLGVANGSPLLAGKLLNQRFRYPVDGGCKLSDGQPVFGDSKTLRGVLASIGSTTIVALALGFEATIGAGIAVGAMAGDLFSSFVKRRMRLQPHAEVFGLDQIPEALLPLLLVRGNLGLSSADVIVLLAAFVALQRMLSLLLFRLGIRDQPY